MDAATREFVLRRANGRCEYCRLPADAAPYLTFHVGHIRARQHHGSDETSNLAFACPECNAKKGPNVATVSPETGQLVELFNPRTQRWDDHFVMIGAEMVGTSEIRLATVVLLDMNNEERLIVREEVRAEGLM
jgi:hypothetical protein